MKKAKLLGLILCITVLFVNTCYARSVDEARSLLLQSRIDFNEQNFFAKIRQKDNFMVSLFIDAGIDINYKTEYGTTPLQTATIYNNSGAVKLLLSQPNIDITIKDNTDKTPLDIASTMGYTEIIDLLKDKGIQQSIQIPITLNDFQINSALSVGKSIASSKKDIVYAEKDTDKTYGGFLGGDMQTAGRTYWITPYCNIANESLTTTKKYTNVNSDVIKRLSNSYQCRVVLSLTNANANYWNNLKIIALQNGKIITPYNVSAATPQVTQEGNFFGPGIVWYRSGFIADFIANDITPNVPLEVKVISNASKELTFHFKNSSPIDFHHEESDEFKW